MVHFKNLDKIFKRTRKGLPFDLIFKILINVCNSLEEFYKRIMAFINIELTVNFYLENKI